MWTRFLTALLAFVAIAAACSDGTAPSPSSTPPPTSVPATPPPATTAISSPGTITSIQPAPSTTAAPTTTQTAPPPPPTTTSAPRTERVELVVAGRAREYTLHIPAGLGASPVPLILDFHGLTSTPDRHERVSNMRAKADVEGFVVAQPAANLAANAWDTLEGSADVGFARAIVADVQTRVAIDPDRVFATGFSAGGGMANRLACDAPDLFAAAGTVAGAHFGWGRCDPSRPVPVISFHGVADLVVPFEGLGLLPDVSSWAAAWAERNGCAPTVQTADVADDVTLEAWTDCDAGVRVLLYAISAGGHGWPGTTDPDRVGDTTAAISATDLMWEFFVTHPRP